MRKSIEPMELTPSTNSIAGWPAASSARRTAAMSDFTPVAEETAVRGYAPTFICESAGTQAEDALAMKQCFMAQAEK